LIERPDTQRLLRVQTYVGPGLDAGRGFKFEEVARLAP
jgi:hypothetical protein